MLTAEQNHEHSKRREKLISEIDFSVIGPAIEKAKQDGEYEATVARLNEGTVIKLCELGYHVTYSFNQNTGRSWNTVSWSGIVGGSQSQSANDKYKLPAWTINSCEKS